MTKARALKPKAKRGLKSGEDGDTSKRQQQQHRQSRHNDTYTKQKNKSSGTTRVEKPPKALKPRKNKSPARKSVAAPRRKRKESSDSVDSDHSGDMIHDLEVSTNKMTKWKPIPKDTTKFVTEIVGANISQIVSRTRGPSLEPVQECLHNLGKQLQVKIPRLKAPVSNHGSYSKLQALKADIEQSIEEENDHLEALDTETERYEKLIEQLEEEKVMLERQMETSINLEDDDSPPEATDTLRLPPLPLDGASMFGLQPVGVRRKVGSNDHEILERLGDLQALS